MIRADVEYKNFLEDILENGTVRDDRTGTGTKSVFGRQLRFNLQEGFPLLTVKKVPFRLVAVEALWFLRGDTNIKYLLDNNVNIWNKDAYRHYLNTTSVEHQMTYDEFIREAKTQGFELDNIYGKQWRRWQDWLGDSDDDYIVESSVDQITQVIESIRSNPYSRRHIVSAWNVGEIHKMALPPCHTLFQFYVADGKLSCQLYQRSVDSFLGLPFNIASYALLTHIIAKMTDLDVGELIISTGDSHIYLNHIEQVKELLSRDSKRPPQLKVKSKHDNIQDYTLEDFALLGYNPHPPIKADLSVGE